MNVEQLILDGFAMGVLGFYVFVALSLVSIIVVGSYQHYKRGNLREEAVVGAKKSFAVVVGIILVFAVLTIVGLLVTLLYRGVLFYL